ncbi:MAG: RNA methyltransferase [Thermoplasmatales archaeon]|nr:RNA methyltransferase [Thermoplasmatales archaeon]
MDDRKNLTEFYVILVEPKYGGNIGAVARAMMNFGFDKLYLVNPCELDDECYSRAVHAYEILEEVEIFSSFEEAIKNMDYLAATSSIESKTDKKHLRNPILIESFAKKIFELEGKVGLVFGREDYGLYNEEIAACDVMLRVPTSDSYLSLNLSHAVSLVLYSIYIKREFIPKERRNIGKIEKGKLYEFFSDLLEEANYPEHKKENTKIMFKRMMGRAMPSKWEYHTLMGVFSRVLEKIRNQKEKEN